MLLRGDVVRLPHGRGNGVVIDCSADGHVHVHVGMRPFVQLMAEDRASAPTRFEPIVEEYVECELIPTGRRVPVAQLAPPQRRRPSARSQFAKGA